MYDIALCWFRRDLRDEDHAALSEALARSRRVVCLFVFDREILDALEDRADRRVDFIHRCLAELDAALRSHGGGLWVLHGRAREEVPRAARELGAEAVFANHDYEPASSARDEAVRSALAASGIAFHTFKDIVVLERDEVLTAGGTPFSVFTPYRRAWLRRVTADDLAPRPVAPGLARLHPPPSVGIPDLARLGFVRTDLDALGIQPGMSGARRLFEDFKGRVDAYRDARDYPGRKGPSYLSVHLRFGTISVRELAAWAYALAHGEGSEGAATWLSELVWREFYHMILHHHPHVAHSAFRPEYASLAFPDDPLRFAAWCEGRTGYPLVDAAMRQLDRTGYMHNRLRMVAASFLVKDLHVDWRLGERYFARRLVDYDLAANNGGWQWAASTGCDAQPWFRIFNPVTQSKRFDPDGRFVRRYVPELSALSDVEIHAPWQVAAEALARKGVVLGRDYPAPVVDHAAARDVTLRLFREASSSR